MIVLCFYNFIKLMYIRKIKVENYRLLKNSILDLTEQDNKLSLIR